MRCFVCLIVVTLLAVVMGCGSENQPLTLLLEQSERPTRDIVSDLAACYKGLLVDETNEEYAALFDQPCIDEMLGVPETTQTQTLSGIVADVISNGAGSTYKDQTVELTSVVRWNFVVRQNTGGITLTTNNRNVIFYVTDFDNPETLRDYTEGETYTFKVYIRNILASTTTAGLWYVYSHEVD